LWRSNYSTDEEGVKKEAETVLLEYPATEVGRGIVG
jgi:hypothetical protein